MSNETPPFVMTPELAAWLIDAGSIGDHEAGIYEAIVGALCTIDDEVHCTLRDVEETSVVTRDVFFTLTHRCDAEHAPEIADFFVKVAGLLQSMRLRHITVDVLRLEQRSIPGESG